MIRAICLISGGLDSILAAKLIQAQGIEAIGVNFTSPVFRYDRPTLKNFDATAAARQLGIPLTSIDITEDILKILKAPKHGFGSNINPCIDCHTMMLKKAKGIMEESGASFLVTGEVVGQRPMSQGRDTLAMIDSEAGVKGLVLRPLSAKVLEPTIPEEKGWVERNRLYGIIGRSRKGQIALAGEFAIHEYPNAAGGCLLTDPSFSKRVKDLLEHVELNEANVRLLKAGRTFRISSHARLIVGRDQQDDELLKSLCGKEDIFFEPEEAVAGASGLGRGDFSQQQTIDLAARIVSRYFDGSTALTINPEDGRGIDKKDGCRVVKVEVSYKGHKQTLEVEPFRDEETKQYLI